MRWGCAVIPASGQSYVQAIAEYEALVGVDKNTMPIRRAYDSGVPSSVSNSQLRVELNSNKDREVLYSIHPKMTTDTATLDSLAHSIADSGLRVRVICNHEPVDEMDGQTFINIYQRSAPFFRNLGIPFGVCYTNWSINLPYSNQQSALQYYWPGDDNVDFLAFDEYPTELKTQSTAIPMADRTLRVCQFADSHNIPLVLAEYGVDKAWPVGASETWLRGVTDWAQQRDSMYRPVDLLYFSIQNVAKGWDYRLGNHEENVDAIKDMIGIV